MPSFPNYFQVGQTPYIVAGALLVFAGLGNLALDSGTCFVVVPPIGGGPFLTGCGHVDAARVLLVVLVVLAVALNGVVWAARRSPSVPAR